MEAHERVRQLVIIPATDVLIIDVLRNGVVDVQQGYGIAGNAGTDVLAQGTVNIHFAGYGNATCSQAAVHIAGLEAKLAGEGRPALIGEGYVLPCTLVIFCPVQ